MPRTIAAQIDSQGKGKIVYDELAAYFEPEATAWFLTQNRHGKQISPGTWLITSWTDGLTVPALTILTVTYDQNGQMFVDTGFKDRPMPNLTTWPPKEKK